MVVVARIRQGNSVCVFDWHNQKKKNYRILHPGLSLHGLSRWFGNPAKRQSCCACSVTYLMMSVHAWDTGIRWMAASRFSWSTVWRVFWRLDAIMSILLVSLQWNSIIILVVCACAYNAGEKICFREKNSVLSTQDGRIANQHSPKTQFCEVSQTLVTTKILWIL